MSGSDIRDRHSGRLVVPAYRFAHAGYEFDCMRDDFAHEAWQSFAIKF